MIDAIGVQNTFLTMAMISLGLFFICVFSLVFYGEGLREWSGTPGWNRSLVRPGAGVGSVVAKPVEKYLGGREVV